MLEGKCLKCGTYRCGWALLNPRYQTCPNCGAGLEITEDGRKIAKGFSPFTADRIDVNPTPKRPSQAAKEKDAGSQKEPPQP
jgi:hypothetical protein